MPYLNLANHNFKRVSRLQLPIKAFTIGPTILSRYSTAIFFPIQADILFSERGKHHLKITWIPGE